MTTRATSTFTFDLYESTPYDEREGATLARTRIVKTWVGDFTGSSNTDALMCMSTSDEGSAAYVGMERLVGSLHGRDGSFVVHHTASGERGTRSGSWTVVPDTGTGELKGLSGRAEIIIDEAGGHTFVLDYEL